uniref:Secreted protein n=1 Tax=Mycena chlorophos TaxID=658473 RepID=A0ABQ0LXW7_MYCCL|nr:predicted protein [Mycena chlorophos]
MVSLDAFRCILVTLNSAAISHSRTHELNIPNTTERWIASYPPPSPCSPTRRSRQSSCRAASLERLSRWRTRFPRLGRATLTRRWGRRGLALSRERRRSCLVAHTSSAPS